MLFRYRFIGKVNNQFVLRGFPFKVGSNIDFCVSEKELEFVKKHCSVLEIIDREPKVVVEIPKSIPDNTTEIVDGIKKQTSQRKHKKNIEAEEGIDNGNLQPKPDSSDKDSNKEEV